MSETSDHDPRDLLIQRKYFSLRPKPLEQWLWKQRVPASAERVFWLHWQEGMIRRDWCSEVALKRVATLCDIDVSSVTRAYQLLTKLGLLRRQDPGRDPARPFERAIAITEVRVPLNLLRELNRHPDRMKPDQSLRETPPCAAAELPNPTPIVTRALQTDPFEGMSGRDRMRALGRLLDLMSPGERQQYDAAMRANISHLQFDHDTRFTATQQDQVLRFLAIVARKPVLAESIAPVRAAEEVSKPGFTQPRRLTVFELARIRGDIQRLGAHGNAAELLREVVWSVEQGALRRFGSLHAIRIALKKIRQGAWTRPNRMPPNWSRVLLNPVSHFPQTAHHDTCRTA